MLILNIWELWNFHQSSSTSWERPFKGDLITGMAKYIWKCYLQYRALKMILLSIECLITTHILFHNSKLYRRRWVFLKVFFPVHSSRLPSAGCLVLPRLWKDSPASKSVPPASTSPRRNWSCPGSRKWNQHSRRPLLCLHETCLQNPHRWKQCNLQDRWWHPDIRQAKQNVWDLYNMHAIHMGATWKP